ncbi:MAG TPA: cyclic nucleotide-binding domain-containing protein [Burkholderiales bacterium]|nr:cyclic nucleotide-binding domain-containing protein [Burkholderiales bacterium]
MAETAERARLAQLESLGDATQFAGQIHGLITFSPLFENFNLEDVGALSQFMQVYRAEPGAEIIREGETGDCMVFLIDGRIEVFKQDRWNSPRLIAVIAPGQSFGEMSMIDGEPRFASCVSAEACTMAVLSRDSLARIILEQPTLGAKILMELVLMLSQRLRQTSSKLIGYMDRERSDQGALPAV